VLVDSNAFLRYNTLTLNSKGSDMQAKQAKQKIDSLMLQLQDMLEIVGLDEHDRIQNAFNALAIELDDVVYPEDL
jgi:hypothetical protein